MSSGPLPSIAVVARYLVVVVHDVLLALLLEEVDVIPVGADEQGDSILLTDVAHEHHLARGLQREEQHLCSIDTAMMCISRDTSFPV
jgi:hypothetical protein